MSEIVAVVNKNKNGLIFLKRSKHVLNPVHVWIIECYLRCIGLQKVP